MARARYKTVTRGLRYDAVVRRSRWFAWWYVTISAGYLLLALHRFLHGERPWLIALRVVISAGFATLAALEFRAR